MAYRLALPDYLHGLHDVFHVGLLKKYDASGEWRSPAAQVPMKGAGTSPQYNLEAILCHRTVGRGQSLQYLVLWKGYDLAQATWEPAAHLEQGQEMVQDYWASQGQLRGR